MQPVKLPEACAVIRDTTLKRKISASYLLPFWVGLMDGDGSIQVNHWRKRSLQFRIVIKLRDYKENIDMLLEVKGLLGGQVRSYKNFVIWVVDKRIQVRKILQVLKTNATTPPLTTRLRCQMEFALLCDQKNDVTWYLEHRDSKYKKRLEERAICISYAESLLLRLSLCPLPLGLAKRDDEEAKALDNFAIFAWLSGFIEAEGCFSISKVPRSRRPRGPEAHGPGCACTDIGARNEQSKKGLRLCRPPCPGGSTEAKGAKTQMHKIAKGERAKLVYKASVSPSGGRKPGPKGDIGCEACDSVDPPAQGGQQRRREQDKSNIRSTDNNGYNNGYKLSARFSLGQKFDFYLLEIILSFLCSKKHVLSKANDFYIIEIYSQETLDRLRSHFQYAPLLGYKRVQYETFLKNLAQNKKFSELPHAWVGDESSPPGE
jgi:hypothetical protein